jgi:hypothetical protein
MFVCGQPSRKTFKKKNLDLAHLDTTDAELDKSTQHLSACHFIRGPAYADFDQKAVVVGRNLCTREAGAGIKTDAVTTRTTVHFNLPCIRLEICRCVFGSDTTLNREATLGDRFLR